LKNYNKTTLNTSAYMIYPCNMLTHYNELSN